ncbi:unnamed protein product [Dimorphilus gyrociliatus]|uniref:Uncharacterized protein n=1 Tax=Dimorphilus gyrociliatus TaxID=2664684 RepID=A0A7I8VFA0_9ANNE|nr:unnamed protein product [Dimorphilus gyrociliatus]
MDTSNELTTKECLSYDQIDAEDCKKRNILFETIHYYGYKTLSQKMDFLQLFHASGAFTNGKTPDTLMTNEEAKNNLLDAGTFFQKFPSISEALKWFNSIGQNQRSRFRPEGMERRQMSSRIDMVQFFDTLVEKFRNLGFIDKIIPKNNTFHTLLILGAAYYGFNLRLQAAANMLKNKEINPSRIILVGGERDLWPNDSDNRLNGETIAVEIIAEMLQKSSDEYNKCDICMEIQSEIDKYLEGVSVTDGAAVMSAHEQIYECINSKYGVKWPTETDMISFLAKRNPIINKYPLDIVNSPKILKEQNKGVWKYVRPNTKSSLEETIRQYGESLMSKSIVIISSQPYCKYQEQIVKSVFNQQYKIEMVAPAINVQEISSKERFLVTLFEAFFSSIYASVNSALENVENIKNQHLDSKESE